jgi:hypothetical protein
MHNGEPYKDLEPKPIIGKQVTCKEMGKKLGRTPSLEEAFLVITTV